MLSTLWSPVYLGAVQQRLAKRGALVLAYHKINVAPRGTRDPFLYETPAGFVWQLRAIRKHGLLPATLTEITSPARDSAILPGKVVITFDDGFVDTLEHGCPIMAREGFTAIQFLVAGHLGGVNEWDVRKGDVPERLMGESQVRNWIAAGHEIGSHSRTHANLRHLSLDQAREEIVGSKKALEDLFGMPVQHFSFPFGSWNPALRDIVIEAGYTSASTMEFGVCDAATSRFELKRIIPLSKSRTFRKIVHRLGQRVMPASSKP